MSENSEEESPFQPAKGDFIAPPEIDTADEATDALPPQEEFWRPPVRFGSLGLADRQEVNFAWKMLSQVRSKVGAVPGLVAGIIEHGD
ncbi:MAG TPA: hypothetical protein VNO69_12455 [Methyloceanibacter sp.]|nr:hypothetical protein [Methyloceanibacter sp.]